MTAEERRLQLSHEREENWQRWGPYLSERQWGTVREDYSRDGDCWNYFPFDDAHARAYRWGEDGILGITDRECRLCFALSMWNGRDEILKERLFGLNTNEGNHGEDVKECYYYLDSTPTHSYMKGLYKYPQREFPYHELRAENKLRHRTEREYDLEDTGAFHEDRYFDVFAEYAKGAPDDILIRLTVVNRGPEESTLHLLPTLWFRNTWIWGCQHDGCWMKPLMSLEAGQVRCTHQSLEPFVFQAEGDPEILFTENETNTQKLFGSETYTPHVKDAFHNFVIYGKEDAVSKHHGTKCAPRYKLQLAPGEERTIRLRLCREDIAPEVMIGGTFDEVFDARKAEADRFFEQRIPAPLSSDKRDVMRQAYAGLMWSKQFYHYVVDDWLKGDRDQPPPPKERELGRNKDWRHLFNRDIISMPDKWEYPWYASWDLAFHMLPFAEVDPCFAKGQLLLFLREWYMHPNGQLPAYEFALSDVNPPVHAWAAWEVYCSTGQSDRTFLNRVFQKLLMNFTWWVNRKDPDGNYVFSGGFLGMDNIGLFDRSRPLPFGDELEQADGTAWMAFYCISMLRIALELAEGDIAAEDIASKFFEHFVSIADATNAMGDHGLWDDDDGFYYDQIVKDGKSIPLKVRSMVGLIPLLAVELFSQERMRRLPDFRKRVLWFLENRGDLAEQISYLVSANVGTENELRILAMPSRERLIRVLRYVLDEDEFLSPFGIRSLSRRYETPYEMQLGNQTFKIKYSPGESETEMFGGNSNWRGPIWFPLNYLLVQALRKYHRFYGDDLKIECPTGSGNMMNLGQVAEEVSCRLQRIFDKNADGCRPSFGRKKGYSTDPHWQDLILFHEYFHAETGEGLGASHQTGWTALIANLIKDSARQ